MVDGGAQAFLRQIEGISSLQFGIQFGRRLRGGGARFLFFARLFA